MLIFRKKEHPKTIVMNEQNLSSQKHLNIWIINEKVFFPTNLHGHERAGRVERAHLSVLLVRAPLRQAIPVILQPFASCATAASAVTLRVPEVEIKLLPATFTRTAVVPPAC